MISDEIYLLYIVDSNNHSPFLSFVGTNAIHEHGLKKFIHDMSVDSHTRIHRRIVVVLPPRGTLFTLAHNRLFLSSETAREINEE